MVKEPTGLVYRLCKRTAGIRPNEFKAVLLSFSYCFSLLGSYYILRPLRDEMGIAGGVKNLPWMFTATFLALLVAAPLLAALVARLPRSKFIPIVYQFFVANILLFWALLTFGVAPVVLARCFFIWTAIFSVFTVSVFWSFMADLYTSEQSKRLFGFIAAGGSVGTVLGPLMTRELAGPLGPVNLLLLSAGLLQIAVVFAHALERAAPSLHENVAREKLKEERKAVRGGMFEGFGPLLRTPYLAGIALWVFLLSLAGTFLYLQQAELVAAASDDPATRTRIFATIDLGVGILTIIIQLLITGRVLARFGSGPALAFLPLVFVIGFATLAVHPVLSAVIIFQAVQRAANFGISNPARETLFTVVTREEKFKTKNIIDGAVFRGADALNAWLSSLLSALLSHPMFAGLTAAIALGWLGLSLGLGRAQERRSLAPAPSPAK